LHIDKDLFDIQLEAYMNRKEQQQAERQRAIADLATKVIEKAQLTRGGSACLVPSTSEPGKKHRVDVDADYKPVACDCKGGRKNCQHKQAVALYFTPRLALLLDSRINPVYGFYRGEEEEKIEARLSQFSKQEKQALLERQRQQEEEASRRAAYVTIFDPNGLMSA
jgi:hypothetical protein